MPETIAYLEAVVGADITSFRRAMAQVRGDITGVHTGISQSLRNVGRDMTYALTIPIAAIGVAALKVTSDYDRAIHNIASISEDFYNNMQANSDAILRFGAATMSGPTAAAEAYYQVVSAGVTNSADAMAIMEASVATAEAGLANLEDTTKGMTQAMLAFGAMSDPAFNSTAEAAQHFSNVLTRTVQLGVGSMDEFVTSMGRAAAATAAAGGSYDDLGIAVSYFTQRGLTSYNASTSMNNMMNKLISPTAELAAVFRELGVATGRELFDKFGDIGGVMNALYSVVGDNTERWSAMFNNIQARRGVFTITNDMQGFLDYIREFNAGLSTATKIARDIQLMSFEAQVKLLSSAMQGLGVQIGKVLIPVLVPLIQKLTDFFLKAMQLHPAMLELIVVVAALVAALGPLVWVIGTLLSPMGLLVTAVVGLGAAFSTNFMGIGSAISNAVTTALPHLQDLLDAVNGFFSVLSGTGSSATHSWDYLNSAMQAVRNGGFVPGTSTQFTVNPGDTLSGLASQTGLSVEQMMQAAGITDPRLLQPGTYTFSTPGTSGSASGGLEGPAQGTLSDRITLAWAMWGARIKSGLRDVLSELGNWLKTTAITLLQTAWNEFVSSIEDLFSNITTGKTIHEPIDRALIDLMNVIAGLLIVFTIGNKLTFGLLGLAVKLGVAITTGLVSHIGAPLFKLLLAPIGAKLLQVVAGALTGAFSWGSFLFQYYILSNLPAAATAIGHALLGLLTAVLTSPVTWGIVAGLAISNLIPEKTKNVIGEAVLQAIGSLIPGVDAGASLDAFRADAESKIYNLLAGIFDLAGNTGLAERLRELARGSGASAERIMMNAFREGFVGGHISIEELTNLTQPGVRQDAWDSFDSAFTFPGQRNITRGGDTPYGDYTPFNQMMVDIAVGASLGLSREEVISSMEEAGLLDAATEAGVTLVEATQEAVEEGIADAGLRMADKGGSQKSARSGSGGGGSPLQPYFAMMLVDIDNAIVTIPNRLLDFAAGIMGAIPSVLLAFGTMALSVGVGMALILTQVTNYADQIIAKWNEMMATIGAAPTIPAYAQPAGGGSSGNRGTVVNMYVTTNSASKINDAFTSKGVSLKDGVTGLVKVDR